MSFFEFIEYIDLFKITYFFLNSFVFCISSLCNSQSCRGPSFSLYKLLTALKFLNFLFVFLQLVDDIPSSYVAPFLLKFKGVISCSLFFKKFSFFFFIFTRLCLIFKYNFSFSWKFFSLSYCLLIASELEFLSPTLKK